ncbi:nudix hydrolase 15, mitochondrial-like [Wolffia australiana]
MRAALRKVYAPMASFNPLPRSRRMESLIQRLRLYRAPAASFSSDSDGDGDDSDDRGKVFSRLGVAELAARSKLVVPRPSGCKSRPRAAVLICLFEDDLGVLRVILTKRSSNLSTHSGEVSLPGGKADVGDVDDAHTATREAKEEIGLDPSLITVVTCLEPFLSKHLLRVIPVIGILSDRNAFKPEINAREVEAIFDAPLEMFLKDENRRSVEHSFMGNDYLIHFFDYETGENNFVIWGLTAGILIRAASIVYQRPPDFQEQKPSFKMAM